MNSVNTRAVTILYVAFLLIYSPSSVFAHEQQTLPNIQRQVISSDELPNVPGHKLTSITVELEPGVKAGAHRHGGFVYAYVLEGRVRSQLNDDEIVEYSAGQAWVEPPGVIHTLTENPSLTEKAKLLVVFVSRNDETLTRPVK